MNNETPADLPDDPRDCCRAILKMQDDDSALAGRLARIPMIAIHFAELFARASREEAPTWAADSLAELASMAGEVLADQIAEQHRIADLARWGTEDPLFRRIVKARAERDESEAA